MLTGSHIIIYSADAEADRAFLRDVLKLPYVDVRDGWLIFGLPTPEVAVHPAGDAVDGKHEFYLMVDDVEQFVGEMKRHQVTCSAVKSQPWGLLTILTLPGGGELGVYQPRHARPPVFKAGS